MSKAKEAYEAYLGGLRQIEENKDLPYPRFDQLTPMAQQVWDFVAETLEVNNREPVQSEALSDFKDMFGLARLAFTRYSEVTGGRSAVTGEKLPAFDDCPQKVKEAWLASTVAVVAECRNQWDKERVR